MRGIWKSTSTGCSVYFGSEQLNVHVDFFKKRLHVVTSFLFLRKGIQRVGRASGAREENLSIHYVSTAV